MEWRCSQNKLKAKSFYEPKWTKNTVREHNKKFARYFISKFSTLIVMLKLFIKEIWAGILANPDVNEDTDFFKAGAGSMDVARFVTMPF